MMFAKKAAARVAHKQRMNNALFSGLYYFAISYCRAHRYAILQSFNTLRRTPLASFLTTLVIGIAIALPCALYLLLQNAESLSDSWSQGKEISVYLKTTTSYSQAQQLAAKWRKYPNIATIQTISPDDGLSILRSQATFNSALAELTHNPLPSVVTITPRINTSAEEIENLLTSLRKYPDIDAIELDIQWIKRFNAIIQLGKDGMLALAILLACAVVFIMGNTLRLVMQNAKDEIAVNKLFGATNAFIRRPFLYMGLLYGLLGSLLAWCIIMFILQWLNNSIREVAALYGSHWALQSLALRPLLGMIAISIALGLVAAFLAVNRYLREV